MKTHKSICIGCGNEIEFKSYEIGDIVKEIDYEITDHAEVGWWDYACPQCGWEYDHYCIELRAEADLEGYCCCLETADEVANFAKLLFRDHPELFE